MSYTIKAVLRNAQQPENGSTEVLFPLSRQEYGDAIERLKELEAGDAVAQDCLVEDIDSFYEVLDCIKGQAVNVDELDYLAKRLDSFDVYEAQQFQASCHALGLRDIKDLIDLTFCSQECTVISDFGKLEQAGKQHYLTIHGGSAPVDEMEKVDGKALAEGLLQSGEGKTTPYGIFFRNGMRMEEPYKGQGFPPYLWERFQAEVELTRPDGEAVPVFLPTTQLAFFRFCERSGIKQDGLKPEGLSWLGSENDHIAFTGGVDEMWEWNDLCERMEGLSERERGIFFAAVEVAGAEDLTQMEAIMGSIHDFVLRPGVKDAESLGRYMIQKSGQYDYDPALEPYYNYECFGEFLMEHVLGRMTRQGYLECAETSAFSDFFVQDAPPQPEQKRAPVQEGFTMEMGGM